MGSSTALAQRVRQIPPADSWDLHHTAAAIVEVVFGGRSLAQICTVCPASSRHNTVVRPETPQPTTRISKLLPTLCYRSRYFAMNAQEVWNRLRSAAAHAALGGNAKIFNPPFPGCNCSLGSYASMRYVYRSEVE